MNYLMDIDRQISKLFQILRNQSLFDNRYHSQKVSKEISLSLVFICLIIRMTFQEDTKMEYTVIT